MSPPRRLALNVATAGISHERLRFRTRPAEAGRYDGRGPQSMALYTRSSSGLPVIGCSVSLYCLVWGAATCASSAF